MNKSYFGIALLVVAVFTLGFAGYVSAQSQWPPDPDVPAGGGWGMMGGRFGWMGNFDQQGPMHEAMVSALAEALDIDPEEIEQRHAAGEHIWEIASEEGLSDEEIRELMESVHDSVLEEAVANGWLTADQAEWMQGHMNWMWSGDGDFYNNGGHCGGMGRYYNSNGW